MEESEHITRPGSQRWWRRRAIWIMLGAVVVGGFLVAMIIVFWPRSPIPAEVRKQVSFVVFYPDKTTGYIINKDSLTYDPRSKVLIFHTKKDDVDLTVSEQAV